MHTRPATNKFNEHFCSIHTVFKDPAESLSNIHFSRLEYMTPRTLNNQFFSIPYITCDCVYSQLIHFYISKSTGSDQISATFLKMAAPIIAPALTQIFNLSICKTEFPSQFKLARVVPIHKQGPQIDYINYRPISVLPITSLILERRVNPHSKSYLELNSLFYFRQSGFREHHYSQTALIEIIDDWLSAINQNKIAGSLFLDILSF